MHQPFPEVFQNSAKLAKWLFPTPCAVKIQNLQGKKTTTPLWSKIVKITNYEIKHTSRQFNFFPKKKLEGKNFLNFDEI